MEVEYDFYSKTRQAVLGYISVATGALSVVRCAIMFMGLWKNEGQLYPPPLLRLLLGLTLTNWMYAFSSTFLGPWAMPAEVSTYVVGATGNWQTCAAAGFFQTFFVGSAWYSFSLGVYHVLTLQFRLSGEDFHQYIEPFCHMMVVLSTVLLGAVALYYEYYVPLYTLPGMYKELLLNLSF